MRAQEIEIALADVTGDVADACLLERSALGQRTQEEEGKAS